ncbi:hypothetical protein L596_024516 [Steinernema carpocapsae]|uniref:Uncharacterized protein n=1 Tax=Steinernema carpocapsae TaxID=34508 RepID=A0A4U5MH08_STECR|nr:hypothetical protein L596_024516 [Steinernema carpocapsae]
MDSMFTVSSSDSIQFHFKLHWLKHLEDSNIHKSIFLTRRIDAIAVQLEVFIALLERQDQSDDSRADDLLYERGKTVGLNSLSRKFKFDKLWLAFSRPCQLRRGVKVREYLVFRGKEWPRAPRS